MSEAVETGVNTKVHFGQTSDATNVTKEMPIVHLTGTDQASLAHHGWIHRDDCIDLLHLEGDWLLRQTLIRAEPKTVLSYMSRNGIIMHAQINVTYQGMFSFNKVRFGTIQEMIDHIILRSKVFEERLPICGNPKLERSIVTMPWNLATPAHEAEHRDNKILRRGAFATTILTSNVLYNAKSTLPIECEHHVVAKTINDDTSFEHMQWLLQAVRAHRRATAHANIIDFIAIYCLTLPITVYTSYANMGDLPTFMRYNTIDDHVVLHFANALVNAVLHLQSRFIIHFQVRAEHCLIKSASCECTPRLMLAGFGLARVLSLTDTIMNEEKNNEPMQHTTKPRWKYFHSIDRSKLPTISLPWNMYVEDDCWQQLYRWWPPELLSLNKTAVVLTDTWSTGVAIWEMFTYCNLRPYDDINVTADRLIYKGQVSIVRALGGG